MTKPRSCPCRYGCVSPGEKDQNGDRRHRSVCREPRSAIITLLLRARRFNATLADGRRPVCRTCTAGRGSRSYFMRLVRLSFLAPDITKAILDGRQPGDLTAEKLIEHSRCRLPGTDQRIVLSFA